MDNVEIWETYPGTGVLHSREKTTIIIHGRHKVTKTAYQPSDGTGSTHWGGGKGTPQIQQGADHLDYHGCDGGTRQEEDEHVMALKRRVKKPSRKDRTTLSLWISDTTSRLVDHRAELGRKCIANQGERKMLTLSFQAALKEGRRCIVMRAGEKIKTLVSKDQLREVWNKTQRWYREAKGHQYIPTREQLDQTSTLWEYLYRRLPPEGAPIPILVQPVSISGGPTEVGEIMATVRKLWLGRAGGPLGMKAEHLK